MNITWILIKKLGVFWGLVSMSESNLMWIKVAVESCLQCTLNLISL